MIEWNAISPKLGDWKDYFLPFYNEGGFEKIYTQLKEEGKNVKIVPEGKDLFKAFEKCPAKDLKTVWLCMSPYYMIKYGTVVSDGLAFSCSHTKEEQPSLKLIYDGIEDDLYDGMNLNMLRNPDLSYLAEQGVLLLNTALTTIEGSADSHKELWKPFIEFFFKEVLLNFSGIPIIMFGKQAQMYKHLVNRRSFHLKEVEHPAYSARQNRPFIHDKLFSWTNEILIKNQKEDIVWIEEPPF